ncbi:MAG: protoporphyrinogen oxidase [Gammaproteobacteria bacterium]|nr:protoporphyrinogen oxidase [Gammaproteobacteria bacterium]
MKTVIVGAGISGLSTAYALLEKQPDMELVVLEASGRVGGKVWSDKSEEGFLCESGVNAFLDNKPKTLLLGQALGLSPVTSFDASRHRFVFSENHLHELPATPPAFLTSNLLSVPGRLRVMMETLVPRGNNPDESLAAFATRRLGREAFEKLIDPMASGVFAGDATQLSLESCFPRIHEVENEFRSLILGLIRLQMKAHREGSKNKPTAGPGGKLTSFTQGMSALPLAIANKLGDRLHLSTSVESITKEGQHYTVHLGNGEQIETERVILASPAHAQARMLEDLAPDIASELKSVPYPSLSICCLGYKRDQIKHDLNGFGFLVPSRERRNILGTLWDASIFPERAPEGYVLLRSMIGGARNSELALLPEEKMIDLVRNDLKDVMGIDAVPDFVRVYKHEQAIPQYVVGHRQRLETINQLLVNHPNLILTGNAYKGVSLNDCVANAYALADTLI